MPDRQPESPASGAWPRRLVVQASLAVACALLAVLTAFVPDWIERLLGLSPDGGSGELEWGIVVALAVAAATCGWFARGEWRRWKNPAALSQRR